MQKKLILDSDLLDITLSRLCEQLIENHGSFDDSVILGLQPRGIFLAELVQQKIRTLAKKEVPLGYLDALSIAMTFAGAIPPPKQAKPGFLL
jgi:pyrimidine operon attenuation protein/uracil phosphoribosyltransferase